MASYARAWSAADADADRGPARRLAAVGAGIAAVAALVGQALQSVPAAAITAVNLGVLGMLVAGFAITRRPKDSLTLAIEKLDDCLVD